MACQTQAHTHTLCVLVLHLMDSKRGWEGTKREGGGERERERERDAAT